MPDAYIVCVCGHFFYLHDEEGDHACVNCDCNYFSAAAEQPEKVTKRRTANVHR